jgi:hypothetical protein
MVWENTTMMGQRAFHKVAYLWRTHKNDSIHSSIENSCKELLQRSRLGRHTSVRQYLFNGETPVPKQFNQKGTRVKCKIGLLRAGALLV